MQNEICIECDGRGFKAYDKGRILAHKDLSIVADLHKIERCETCGGYGYYSNPILLFRGLFWLVIGLFIGFVIILQF